MFFSREDEIDEAPNSSQKNILPQYLQKSENHFTSIPLKNNSKATCASSSSSLCIAVSKQYKNYKTTFLCFICNIQFSIQNSETTDINSHMKTKKHQDCVKSAEPNKCKQKTINSLFNSSTSELNRLCTVEGALVFHESNALDLNKLSLLVSDNMNVIVGNNHSVLSLFNQLVYNLIEDRANSYKSMSVLNETNIDKIKWKDLEHCVTFIDGKDVDKDCLYNDFNHIKSKFVELKNKFDGIYKQVQGFIPSNLILSKQDGTMLSNENNVKFKEKVAIQPMTTQSSLTSRTFAPLNTPLYRRRQTLTILVFWILPWFCLYVSLLLLRSNNWYLFFGFIAYLTWMVFFRKYPRQGGLKQQWLRRLVWWKWFADYFPIQLHRTCDLPADRSYIFGYHPHGIISLGAFCNFATEATGFEEKFPGINLRLLTLKSNFRIPFFGFYLSLLGLCDASKESCNYILEKGNGNSLMLVLGGVKEVLDARPSCDYILTLKNRKGFVKIGLVHGASLVPVFSFGENDLYEQLANPRGSKLRQFQVMLQKKTGYTIPFFRGRGVFQYAFGFLPNRRAINTYVGEPIELPKLSREEITNE
ncbi:unnamed protein product, partial [Rotaria sordida]